MTCPQSRRFSEVVAFLSLDLMPEMRAARDLRLATLTLPIVLTYPMRFP
jgi:hypothetical protein